MADDGEFLSAEEEDSEQGTPLASSLMTPGALITPELMLGAMLDSGKPAPPVPATPRTAAKKKEELAAVEAKVAALNAQYEASMAKKADLEGTQKELDAALAYYDKLKPSCVDAGVSYEDRVARRKEEIE